MNARKKKKRIKKQIEQLKNECNQYRQVNVKHSYMPFTEFKAHWQIPDIYYGLTGKSEENLINYAKEELAKTLLEDIQKAGLINYRICPDFPYSFINAHDLFTERRDKG